MASRSSQITYTPRPSRITACISLGCFIVFFSLIAGFCSNAFRATRSIVGIGCIVFAAIQIGGFVFEYRNQSTNSIHHKGRKYSKNLGNSFITAVLATLLMGALYVWQWYPLLNRTTFEVSQDLVVCHWCYFISY
jgi:ABC-type uncharacterized transport system permease subunit